MKFEKLGDAQFAALDLWVNRGGVRGTSAERSRTRIRLVFVNRFYLPDGSATAQMLGDLIQAFKGTGYERHVIASHSQYTEIGDSLPSREKVDGVQIKRLFSLRNSKKTLFPRAINFLLFYGSSFFYALKIVRRGDIIVCLTDPPLGCVAMRLVAGLKGARMINWIQDIYPETAHRLGYSYFRGMVSSQLSKFRDYCWKQAKVNVVIGDVMANYLRSRGVRSRTIVTIPNWADEIKLSPRPRGDNALRRAWAIDDEDCLVGYSGNLGRAHDTETVIDAIRSIAGDPASRLKFLFVGGGAGLDAIREMHEELDAGRVILRDYQPREQLCESLSAPDVHWLSLNPALEGLIIPSKFYSAAAVGRPIIFVGAPKGEIARLIAEAECGRSFAPGQSAALAAYLRELEADKGLRERLGANARAFSTDALSRTKRHGEWRRLIGQVALAY